MSEPKVKFVAPTAKEIHVRNLKAQLKSLEAKLDKVGDLHSDMQGMSQSLTEKRIKDVKALIAKNSK